MSEIPDKPGRMVRMSAFGSIDEGLIPNALNSAGVAT